MREFFCREAFAGDQSNRRKIDVNTVPRLRFYGSREMNTGSLTVELVKLTLCGPTDVAKEISIASEIINDWNCQHSEQRGFWVKHQHWSTDSYPDAQETGQGAINKQLIDSTDILVAIFGRASGRQPQVPTRAQLRRYSAQSNRVKT